MMLDALEEKSVYKEIEKQFLQHNDVHYRKQEPLAAHVTLKVGGAAAFWVEPRSSDAAVYVILQARRYQLPFVILGGGSNIVASDEGFPGIVMHLPRQGFSQIEQKGSDIRVGCATSLVKLVRTVAEWGLSGCQHLAGIPGQVGGAIFGNAGTRGLEAGYAQIGDVVHEVFGIDASGQTKTWGKEALNFEYRSSAVKAKCLLEAKLSLEEGDKEFLQNYANKLNQYKQKSQEYKIPSAGCWFKNSVKGAAALLIDQSGLKGYKVGGAQVSEKHANFFLNVEGATCSDFLKLEEYVVGKVEKDHGIRLEREVRTLQGDQWEWC